MSSNRSIALLCLAALMSMLSSCTSTTSNRIYQQPAEIQQDTLGQSDFRIYGSVSTSITHATR